MVVSKKWSPELEGLRGLASLWVVLGHICILTQFNFPILSDPGIGVDLFILLSGFLMAKNYMSRKGVEPWEDKSTVVKFWTRRFFRIAPLYYTLLIVAIVLGPWYGDMRDIISSFYPTTATSATKYSDQSFSNIITHITFIFGFIPRFSFNTVLPDWSIGLEMQYYFLFPFIMLVVMRFGFAKTCISIMVMCLVLIKLMPDYFRSFSMPSMIAVKLHLFIAGMLISEAVRQKNILFILAAMLAPLFSVLINIKTSHIRVLSEAAMILFIAAILWETTGKNLFYSPMLIAKKILTNKIVVILGDVSYSVYLLHLLIVLPAVAIILNHTQLSNLPGYLRFASVALVSLPIIYGMAYFLFKFIEKPGIKFGKMILENSATPVSKETI